MNHRMQAARLYGPGTEIKIEEVPYPVPGPGDVVVRVAACGICGSDVHFLEGMPVPAGLPFTLGHEPAGIVETIGVGVRDWQPGDRVALHLGAGCGTCRVCVSGHPNCCPHLVAPGLHIDGAFAEAIRVPAGTLVRVPDGVSLVAAAVSTDCVASPYHALACRAGQLRLAPTRPRGDLPPRRHRHHQRRGVGLAPPSFGPSRRGARDAAHKARRPAADRGRDGGQVRTCAWLIEEGTNGAPALITAEKL